MTKKTFKEEVDYHNYVGGRSRGYHAFYFDYATGDFDKGEHWRGFKYLVYCRKENATKTELFNIFYQFINGEIENFPHYVIYKIAATDNERFKIQLVL
jgi:hypothetical protein